MKLPLLLFSIFALLIGYLTNERFDYKYFYSPMWSETLNGKSPWLEIPLLIYPPAFNLLAIPYSLHHLLPKFIFILSGLLIFIFLFRTPKNGATLSNLGLLLNPFFFIFACVFGSVDILVAALCIWAIAFAKKNFAYKSSFVLALATSLKVYPILLAPVFLLNLTGNKRIQWLSGFLTPLLLSTFLGWLFWGNTSFLPYLRIPFHEPKLLSLPAFLHAHFPEIEAAFRIFASMPYLLYSLIFLSAWALGIGLCFFYKLEIHLASMLVFLLCFATFKTGHIQFLSVIVFLLMFQLVKPEKTLNKSQLFAFTLLYCWIQIVTLWYYWPHLLPFDVYRVRQFIGLPHFIFTVLFTFIVIKSQNSRAKAQL